MPNELPHGDNKAVILYWKPTHNTMTEVITGTTKVCSTACFGTAEITIVTDSNLYWKKTHNTVTEVTTGTRKDCFTACFGTA